MSVATCEDAEMIGWQSCSTGRLNPPDGGNPPRGIERGEVGGQNGFGVRWGSPEGIWVVTCRWLMSDRRAVEWASLVTTSGIWKSSADANRADHADRKGRGDWVVMNVPRMGCCVLLFFTKA